MPMTPIDKQSFGEGGCVVLTATTITAGQYCAVQCLTDVVLTVTAAQAPLATGLSGVTLPAGTILYTPLLGGSLTGTAVFYVAL
jgi:hypothetical protein